VCGREESTVSDSNPGGAGEFLAGSSLAGYRLDEIIGRGGMAVVYRAFDSRLERRVALKVLAPELARDGEFRQRFIRESRAAAAVDHPNVLPVFEAGEADGVLFIAMRYVQGGDVRTLIDEGGPVEAARACAIVAQVASALDVAHAHGLVHRDVKPANILRDAASYAGQPDHVYLADFGLSKGSHVSANLTSRGHFLGTLNYVAPEQIEGRTVDGRADLYALACSAFEMLAGQPPFRRDDNMAIMWAQVNAPPPALTEFRPDLPPAVDAVLTRALAKKAGDRYVTCLEFAAALAAACGLRAAEPQLAQPDQAAPPPGRRPPGPPPAQPPPHPETAPVGAGRLPLSELAGRRGGPPGGPPGAHRPGAAPQRPWLARRSGAVAMAALVAVLGAAGGYLLLNKGNNPHAGAAARHAHDTGIRSAPAATRVITPPGCTSQVAMAGTLHGVPSRQVPVGKVPFDVVLSGTGFGFVSDQAGITVLATARPVPAPLRTIPLAGGPQGEALTPDGRYLLVAAGSGMTVFRASAIEHGPAGPVGSLTVPGGQHAVEVAVSPSGAFAFLSLQNSHQVAVFNLHRALAAGFGPADLVGTIRFGKDPIGIAVAPGGKYLYVASGLARPASTSGPGTLTVVDVAKAETRPASSVVKTINAGCGPDRMAFSPDGRYLWLTSGGGNAVLAYSAAALVTDPRHALVAKVALGELPLGMAFIHQGAQLVVADSNRDQLASAMSSLAVVDVRKALAGQPGALLGLVKSGLTPRQFALTPDGATLLVTNTESGDVQVLRVAHLP
jgi:DNA-binding beta-propeller fold protein YncE/tRNA A-37 threonylcarbamoyl transferase component Bud32